MQKVCLKCKKSGKEPALCSNFVRFGFYYRTSDARLIQRYRCLTCRSCFSSATFHPCFRQKKRHKNGILRSLLSSGVSQRRSARILRLNRITVVRKFLFLAKQGEALLKKDFGRKVRSFQFDDMETFEHSKYKPLSITLAVESKTRRILGLRVSVMAAKGLLTQRARKYDPRPDGRRRARRELFREIKPLLTKNCQIKSDQNPHYAADIRQLLPNCRYIQHKGARGANTGQGELKRKRFDPLFSLNHTCAKLRADVNRLIRKTWCTTKRADRLQAHLYLYANYHNLHL